jgi:hypothetical protein
MSEKHYKDLCDIIEALADVQQIAELQVRIIEKLRKLNAEIRTRISNCEMSDLPLENKSGVQRVDEIGSSFGG